ncbi:fungal protein [Schizosaccharomyces cryophilus OY26]|uniref:Fungal protein n=1 Tax=Schizosaccharomyces cryophilus (strain OY26 / ATCC MYA-4695 / CBS 11777 / NBRC 106824 / NRRL Y48691) TaxID=653667 RepID=S9W6D2_SCHCR|nr:uncharacterized protein SPOG_04007 [Schizosaccharomyces cryophilus OY26]EPY54114.1 fungal protein [Schizosaccharomyces cryophilus OY26]
MKLIALVASFFAAAFAYNEVTAPATNAVIQEGGGVYTVSWNNLTSDTVTLTLLSGSNDALQPLETIASNIKNTGTYGWKVPSHYPSADNYLLSISWDGDSSYSKYFTFQACSTCTISSIDLSYSGSMSATSVAASNIGTRSATSSTTSSSSPSSSASRGSSSQSSGSSKSSGSSSPISTSGSSSGSVSAPVGKTASTASSGFSASSTSGKSQSSSGSSSGSSSSSGPSSGSSSSSSPASPLVKTGCNVLAVVGVVSALTMFL